jgi:Insertion element 4 transposase N-terminal/Transposase DDE domain
MSFRLQQIPPESKLCQALHVEVLERVYPRELVARVLSQCHGWEERERKLNHLVMVYYLMALTLWRRHNLRAVYRQLAQGLLWLAEQLAVGLPTAAALLYRRRRLGIAVLRHLLRQQCRPLPTQATPGAFRFGLRLMALDSTLQEVADSPANALHFGRLTEGKSRSPFPQVRCLFLAEIGTHAIVDAVLASCRKAEQRLVQGILRSVEQGMLILCDRNFPSAPFIAAVRQRGAQVLARLSQDWYASLPSRQWLSDGSYLVTLQPRGQAPFQVRIIEYFLHPTLTQELETQPHSRNCPVIDPTQKHRLLTTLLDPQQAPALELILCYHERWEIELCIDEIKAPQRLSDQPLRSQDPHLVYQELYGLLLAHYAVRWWMAAAAAQAHLDPDRLSFTHAVQLLDLSGIAFSLLAREDVAPMQHRLLTDLWEPSTLLPPRRLLLVAVNEEHHVSVILDGPRFAQVRELGHLHGAALDGARELGQRQNRDVEFLGDPLEAATDLGDLLLAHVLAFALDGRL